MWKSPTETERKLQKNGGISEGTIFSNKFSNKIKNKIQKNSIFLQNFHQKISKFSQNFSTICVFRPSPKKINVWFVKYFEKYAKIVHSYQFSNEIFSKISKVFSKFPINCLFRPKGQKINAWFVKLYEKLAKIMHFEKFPKKFFQSFRAFSQIFQYIVFFLNRCKKLPHSFLNFVKNC